MTGTYRKEGASARVATLRGETRATTARESGVAGYSGGRFFSASVEASEDVGGTLLAEARALHEGALAAAGTSVAVERLRVVRGAASHRFEPPGDEPRAWSEMQAVLHLTLLAPSGARVSILRGGASIGDIDPREITTIAIALANARPRRRARQRASVALSPAVSAAIAAELSNALSPHLIVQESHPDFATDGVGNAIDRFDPAGRARAEWPNLFRPSYRSPASAALMHVALSAGGDQTTGESELALVELLRPPHAGEHGVILDALCARERESFLASIEIPAGRLAAAVAGGPRIWFPFGAGAWGRGMSVEGARVR